jgi:hypothetical protein
MHNLKIRDALTLKNIGFLDDFSTDRKNLKDKIVNLAMENWIPDDRQTVDSDQSRLISYKNYYINKIYSLMDTKIGIY